LPVTVQKTLPAGYAASLMMWSTSAAGINLRLPSLIDRSSPDRSCE